MWVWIFFVFRCIVCVNGSLKMCFFEIFYVCLRCVGGWFYFSRILNKKWYARVVCVCLWGKNEECCTAVLSVWFEFWIEKRKIVRVNGFCVRAYDLEWNLSVCEVLGCVCVCEHELKVSFFWIFVFSCSI